MAAVDIEGFRLRTEAILGFSPLDRRWTDGEPGHRGYGAECLLAGHAPIKLWFDPPHGRVRLNCWRLQMGPPDSRDPLGVKRSQLRWLPWGVEPPEGYRDGAAIARVVEVPPEATAGTLRGDFEHGDNPAQWGPAGPPIDLERILAEARAADKYAWANRWLDHLAASLLGGGTPPQKMACPERISAPCPEIDPKTEKD